MSFILRPDSAFQLGDSVADTAVTRWSARLVGHKARTFFSYGVTKQMVKLDKPVMAPISFYRKYTSYISGRISGEELVVYVAEQLDVPSDRIDLQSIIHSAICVGRVIGYSATAMIPYMATHPVVVSILSACGVRFLIAALSEVEGGEYKLYPGFPIQLIDQSVKDMVTTVFLVAKRAGVVEKPVRVQEISKAQRDVAVVIAHGVFKNELIRRTAALRSEGFVLKPVTDDMEALVATRLADFLNRAEDVGCFLNRVEKEEYFDRTMYSIATVSDGQWSIDYIPMYFDEFVFKGYVAWPTVVDEKGFLSVTEMTTVNEETRASMLTGVEDRALPNSELTRGCLKFYQSTSGFYVENRTDDIVADMAVDAARVVCPSAEVDKRFSGMSLSSDVDDSNCCNGALSGAPLRHYRDTKHEVDRCSVDSGSTQELVEVDRREAVEIAVPVVESQTDMYNEYTASLRPNRALSVPRNVGYTRADGSKAVIPAGHALDPAARSIINMWNRSRPKVPDRELVKNITLRELRSMAAEFTPAGTDAGAEYEANLVHYCGMRIDAVAEPVVWVCDSSDGGTYMRVTDAKCRYAAVGHQYCGRPFFLKNGLIGDPLLHCREGAEFLFNELIDDSVGIGDVEKHALVVRGGPWLKTDDVVGYYDFNGSSSNVYGLPAGIRNASDRLDLRPKCPPIGPCYSCNEYLWFGPSMGVDDDVVLVRALVRSSYRGVDTSETHFMGLGFVIGRYIITAAHIVKIRGEITLYNSHRGWDGMIAHVAAVSEEHDIAILAVFPPEWVPGKLTWSDGTEDITNVFYRAGQPIFNRSTCLAVKAKRMSGGFIRTSDRLGHGYSGAPLVTKDGTLVGMYLGWMRPSRKRKGFGIAVEINREIIAKIMAYA